MWPDAYDAFFATVLEQAPDVIGQAAWAPGIGNRRSWAGHRNIAHLVPTWQHFGIHISFYGRHPNKRLRVELYAETRTRQGWQELVHLVEQGGLAAFGGTLTAEAGEHAARWVVNVRPDALDPNAILTNDDHREALAAEAMALYSQVLAALAA